MKKDLEKEWAKVDFEKGWVDFVENHSHIPCKNIWEYVDRAAYAGIAKQLDKELLKKHES